MTASDFKKANGYRLSDVRNCANCRFFKISEKKTSVEWSYSSNCFANGIPFGTSCTSVCDSWKKKEPVQ